MHKIGLDTRISKLIREHPGALDAIVGISPRFEKLRNPILRKVMAPRTTIGMACKVAGIPPQIFFNAMLPLGFELLSDTTDQKAHSEVSHGAFMHELSLRKVHTLDVRPLIESGQDPLQEILLATKNLAEQEVLLIINTFEPAPLIQLLSKQGFDWAIEHLEGGVVHTYFSKTAASQSIIPPDIRNATDWDEIVKRFTGKTRQVDVRNLDMPMPMRTILSELETLPADQALFVHHKRIPVFLLPELNDQGWAYRVKELNADLVEMIIFRSK